MMGWFNIKIAKIKKTGAIQQKTVCDEKSIFDSANSSHSDLIILNLFATHLNCSRKSLQLGTLQEGTRHERACIWMIEFTCSHSLQHWQHLLSKYINRAIVMNAKHELPPNRKKRKETGRKREIERKNKTQRHVINWSPYQNKKDLWCTGQ